MPTKRILLQPIDANGKVGPLLLITKTSWQTFSQNFYPFFLGMFFGVVLAICGMVAI